MKEKPDWRKMEEDLREEFEELFPKGENTEIESSPSNRSAGLVLYAKHKIILQFALEQERKEMENDIMLRFVRSCENDIRKQTLLEVLPESYGWKFGWSKRTIDNDNTKQIGFDFCIKEIIKKAKERFNIDL
jgi:hypothetical protein